MKMFLARYKNIAARSRNSGFTFTEILITFSFFLMLISFIAMGMNFLLQESPMEADVQKLEWEVFLSQMKKELRMSDEILSTGNKLSLMLDGENITYDMYGSLLRRQVNGRGHEVVLQKVQSVSFASKQQGIEISVEDTYGRTYSAVIRTLLQEGAG